MLTLKRKGAWGDGRLDHGGRGNCEKVTGKARGSLVASEEESISLADCLFSASICTSCLSALVPD